MNNNTYVNVIIYIYIYISKILKKKWQDGIWHDIFWYLNDLLGAVTVSIHQGRHISACWGFTMLNWVWPGAIVLLIDWFHAIVLHQVVELSYRCIWKWTAYCGLKRARTMKQSFNIWLIDNISENSRHMRPRAFAYNVCIHACLFAGKEQAVYYTMEKKHSA